MPLFYLFTTYNPIKRLNSKNDTAKSSAHYVCEGINTLMWRLTVCYKPQCLSRIISNKNALLWFSLLRDRPHSAGSLYLPRTVATVLFTQAQFHQCNLLRQQRKCPNQVCEVYSSAAASCDDLCETNTQSFYRTLCF